MTNNSSLCPTFPLPSSKGEFTYMKDKNTKIIFFFVFCFFILFADTVMIAQNTAPYVDKSGRFKVFDNGEIHDLEHEEVRVVNIGGDYVIYKDNIGQGKIYEDGETVHITDDERIQYYATEGLMASIEGVESEILKVGYGDDAELLTIDFDPKRFAIEDSVLVFIDNFGYLSVYYQGETHEVAGQVPNGRNFKVSFNSVVYSDGADVLRIFHEGETSEVYHRRPNPLSSSNSFDLPQFKPFKDIPSKTPPSRHSFAAQKEKEHEEAVRAKSSGITYVQPSNRVLRAFLYEDKDEAPNSLSTKNSKRLNVNSSSSSTGDLQTPPACHVGDDFVLFLDEMDNLVVYDEGELTTLTEFTPNAYQGGDKMATFVNNDNKYMVYWNGKVQELAPRPPKFQIIQENTLAYIDDLGFFHVFDNGKNISLEAYKPEKLAISDGVVVYTDLDGRLKAYYEGKQMKVSSEIIQDFQLVGRVILFTLGNNKVKIFHAGNHYSG